MAQTGRNMASGFNAHRQDRLLPEENLKQGNVGSTDKTGGELKFIKQILVKHDR